MCCLSYADRLRVEASCWNCGKEPVSQPGLSCFLVHAQGLSPNCPIGPLTSIFYLVSGVYWEVSHTTQMPRAIKFCAQLIIPTFGQCRNVIVYKKATCYNQRQATMWWRQGGGTLGREVVLSMAWGTGTPCNHHRRCEKSQLHFPNTGTVFGLVIPLPSLQTQWSFATH